MAGTYLDTVILYCLNRINGERSIYSVYHLLKGKKSSQTIQDAHLFQLDHLFQSFHFLSREKFDEIVVSFEKRNWLKKGSEHDYFLADGGQDALKKQISDRPLPDHLDGFRLHLLTHVFWERFSLLIQVCSNLIHQHTEYIPIQRKSDTQSWIKRFLKKSQRDRDEIATHLYQEIVRCFETEPALNPIFFVMRLSGYNRIGLTTRQAADFLNCDLMYYHLQFLNQLHFMIKKIIDEPEKFPFLQSVIVDLDISSAFTISTRRTFELLLQGSSIEEIALLRNLKKNTIEDHVVEIALVHDSFDISGFVPLEKQKIILAAIKQSESRQLRQIRELADGSDYFEIRLVMAKFGETKWN
jgi:uncharacterized protein YpbB